MQRDGSNSETEHNTLTRRQEMDELYKEVRLLFLKMCYRCNVVCPITEEPIDIHSDVHHKKGRSIHAYADEWAKENDIPLFIDPRFFLAVSRRGHQHIETHPNQAKLRGWSLNRLDALR